MGSGNESHNNILPSGKYILVSIDIDTTGRRLIDEIVQLSAYTPQSQFAQYIMPYMNLNPAARQRHQIRVVTIGFYRMLKCMQTYKVVKSKSEIAALKDFLDWIEKLMESKSDSSGLILLYHEERKFTPYMVLEAFKKYGLQERFLKTVKYFANGYELAKSFYRNVDHNSKHFSLRKLSKLIQKTDKVNSNKNMEQQINDFFEGSASVRAKSAYEVTKNLTIQMFEQKCYAESTFNTPEIIENSDIDNLMFQYIYEFCQTTTKVLSELEIQNINLERQNSFRPLFLQYFKTTLYHRVRAVKFRIILAENGLDFETLKAIWMEKRKEGLTEVIQAINDLKSFEKVELIELLDSHFDPTKQPIKPVIKKPRRRSRRYQRKDGDDPNRHKNKGAGDEKCQLQDSVTNQLKKTSSNRSRNTSSSKNNEIQTI